MSDNNVKWSPRPWALREFPEDLHSQLQQLELNLPLLTDRINGDELYVRRVGLDHFECGLLIAPNRVGPERASANKSLSPEPR